jgi:hypothetical protein
MSGPQALDTFNLPLYAHNTIYKEYSLWACELIVSSAPKQKKDRNESV